MRVVSKGVVSTVRKLTCDRGVFSLLQALGLLTLNVEPQNENVLTFLCFTRLLAKKEWRRFCQEQFRMWHVANGCRKIRITSRMVTLMMIVKMMMRIMMMIVRMMTITMMGVTCDPGIWPEYWDAETAYIHLPIRFKLSGALHANVGFLIPNKHKEYVFVQNRKQ